MKPIQTKHELQFDYFSENYHQFEMDFYKWAATSTPLVFLEDDILHSMAAGQRNNHPWPVFTLIQDITYKR